MAPRKIHRGEILQAAAARSHLSVTSLMKRIGYSRGSWYVHIEDPDLPLDILALYGKALGYDFSADVPGMEKPQQAAEPEEPGKAPATMEEALQQRDYWREKYYRLLEQFHRHVMDGGAPRKEGAKSAKKRKDF